jgi:hypothetical protein
MHEQKVSNKCRLNSSFHVCSRCPDPTTSPIVCPLFAVHITVNFLADLLTTPITIYGSCLPLTRTNDPIFILSDVVSTHETLTSKSDIVVTSIYDGM